MSISRVYTIIGDANIRRNMTTLNIASRDIMKKAEVMTFLVAFLVSGALWGFLENFLFWLLEDLGSTKFLMGMSQAVGTLATLPLTIFSGKFRILEEKRILFCRYC